MFFAEPVKLYNIIAVKEIFSPLTKRLLDFGGAHVEEKLNLIDLRGFSQFEAGDLLSRLESLALRVESLGKILEFPLDKLSRAKVDPFLQFPEDGLDFEKGLMSLENKIKDWEKAITGSTMLLEEKKDFIFLHEQVSWFFSVLLHAGIESLYELDDTFLTWRFGNIPKDNIYSLKQALSEVPFSMEFANISRNRCVMLIVTLPVYAGNIDAALHAAGFISVSLPKISSTSMLSDFEDDMELALWEARDEIAQIKARISQMAYEYYPKLGGAVKLINMYKNVLRSMTQVKASGQAVVLNVWVLEKNAVDFENLLASEFKNRIYYESLPARETDIPLENVPAKFPVGILMRPFFAIVEMFGYPSYGELNPMFFVFLNMVIMFGIMFADVGHGGLLTLLGIFLWRYYRDIAVFLIPLGISSLLFGFVFGSVFGSENIIRPLWVASLKNPNSVILLSVSIGVLNLILAISLNLLIAVRKGNWRDFGLGQWGVFSLGAYIAMLSLALPISGMAMRPKLIAFLAMLFAPVLIEAYYDKKHHRPVDVAAFIFHPFEVFLTLFSNTVSYVRIAAFNFNHAALMMVVFTLADVMSDSGRLSFIKIIVLLFGNFLVMGLESVLSSIQCLRLNYYEFFTKFYQGGGRKFVPLKWM